PWPQPLFHSPFQWGPQSTHPGPLMHADAYPQGPLTQTAGSAGACPAPATANTSGSATAPSPTAVFPRIPDQLIRASHPSRTVYEHSSVGARRRTDGPIETEPAYGFSAAANTLDAVEVSGFTT